MSDKSVLSSLLRSLGLAPKSENGAETGSGAHKQNSVDTSFREFETRLNKTLNARQREIEGRVYLISFANVRRHLGKRWNVAAERIHALVERVFDRRLVEHDIFLRYGEDAYLVVFAVLGPKEAQLKCTRIAEDILKRLVGSDTVAQFIDVKSVHPDGKGGIETRPIPKPEVLVGEVVQRLSALPQETPEDKTALTDEAEPNSPLQVIEFIFRPLLTVRTKVVSTFLCIPVQARPNGGFESGYQILPAPRHPDQIFDLDIRTLTRISSELSRMTLQNTRSLLGVPVHYETLGSPKSRTNYLKLCAEWLEKRKHQIVFEVVGVPHGVPHAYLLELRALIQPFSRAVIARTTMDQGDLSGFKAAGMHAVGVDLHDLRDREKTIMSEMDEFVRKAKVINLKTYVHGVRSISLYTAAVCSGVDYFAGYAVESISKVPRDAYVFSPDMPYLSLFGGEAK